MANSMVVAYEKDYTKAELIRKCFELKCQGLNQNEIAKEIGVGTPTVSNYLKEAYIIYRQQHLEEMSYYIDMELEQLNKLIKEYEPRIRNILDAAFYLKVIESRRKLLGLEAATKVDISLQGQIETKIADLSDDERNAIKEKYGF